MTNPITPELFEFFRQLARNNNREWFEANKKRYHEVVRDPLLSFVSDFGPALRRINPHFVADPRPVGGALFRIHRDIRFSKDKTPYKTHAGLRFPHEDGKDVHVPGYYLHLEPGEVFVGSGIWHPDGATLQQIREGIVAKPANWKRATRGLTLGGDALKRPPKGYDPDHALIEDLKRKDFIAYESFSERDACGRDFMRKFTQSCRRMKPLVGFLTRSVGASF